MSHVIRRTEFLAVLEGLFSPSLIAFSNEGLSDREPEVLCLFGKGQMPGEVAKHLNLSIKTMSTYRARLLEKLRLKTSTQLIRYAVTQQLVD